MSVQMKVEFLFDVGSPNAYLCHKLIPAIEERTGAEFEYVPILLGGLFKLANNRSPLESLADIPNKRAYMELEMDRFVRRHGLGAYRSNPHFPVNTLKIMRGACAAQLLGCFERYVDTVYSAMWEQGRNLGEEHELLSVLAAAGLDGSALIEQAASAEVKAALLANTERAYERGAFGSPTFFVNDEIYFGKDRLREVEEAILAASAD